jgi:hypothetical protein
VRVERFIDSDLAARLDRLPFSRWHGLVVTALGITWMLDGLEVTIVGALGSVLQEPGTLGLSAGQVGLSGTRASAVNTPPSTRRSTS